MVKKNVGSIIVSGFMLALLLMPAVGYTAPPAVGYTAPQAGESKDTVSDKKVKTDKSKTPDSRAWELLSDDFYLSKRKLTKSSDNLSVQTYRIIKDDEKNYLIDYFKESDFQKSVKYRNLDHQIIFLKFNCKKKSSKIEKLVNYDVQDNVLYEETYDNAAWTDIVVSSKLEVAYQKACVASQELKKQKSQKKKHKTKKTKKTKKSKKTIKTKKPSTK